MKLISAQTFKLAQEIAHAYRLNHWEWKYIPYGPEDIREQRLRGRRVKEEDLIGSFSDDERFYLVERFKTEKGREKENERM